MCERCDEEFGTKFGDCIDVFLLLMFIDVFH